MVCYVRIIIWHIFFYLDHVPMGHTPPKVTTPLTKSVVFEGNSTKFECQVLGYPPPEIIW